MMFGEGRLDAGATLVAAQLYTPSGIIHMAFCAALVLGPVQSHEWSAQITWPKAFVLVPLLGLALTAMFAQSFNPFLYFQF